jgi:hypothetical protein
MNWRSQQNEQEAASQLLKLAHPPKEPLWAKRTIYAVGSPEKGSTMGASVPSTLLDARLLPNPFLELGPIEREDKAVLPAAPSPFLQPSREQLSKQISGTKPRAARRASSHAAEYTDQIEFDFKNGRSCSSRA